MPWTLPAPGDISSRSAAIYETEFARIYALRNPGAPPAVVDARSPNSTLAVHGRVLEAGTWDLWLYQARCANELMPDTAIDWLSRHGAIWGVPQDQPVPASGTCTATITEPATIVAGELATSSLGTTYISTADAVGTQAGPLSVPVAAVTAGSAGNLPTGTVLTFVSPVPGVQGGTMVVDANAISGGLDLESLDSWRSRILARIRQRGSGGSGNDYVQWTGEVLPAAVVRPLQMSLGIVNVVLAINQGLGLPPRVPTDTEVSTLLAYLNDPLARKPLGMTVLVTPATLLAVNFSITLNPDNTANRAAALSSLQDQFLIDADVGGTIFVSRMDAALSNGSGEFSHERTAPAADVVAGATQLPILGTVTFGTPA